MNAYLATERIKSVLSEESFTEHCFDLWSAHLKWLADLGFQRAYETCDVSSLPASPTGHEVVSLLHTYISSTGYVNAHLGLTSSDIVDNVRLIQIAQSINVIQDRIADLGSWLHVCFGLKDETPGFTHWQVAAPVMWQVRWAAWVTPLALLSANAPDIHAKKFGGPTGDCSSLKKVIPDFVRRSALHPFQWSRFGLRNPVNENPIQSSDHLCEISAIQWFCVVAAQLHKIAQDLRFLASHNMVFIDTEFSHAGSSSMPHKVNPYKWEKVCSICRSVATTQDELWDVMAHNSMERTLDTSWQIKRAMSRCITGLALAIDEMFAVKSIPNLKEAQAVLDERRQEISSDAELTRRVVEEGKPRWFAYLEMLNSTTSKTETK